MPHHVGKFPALAPCQAGSPIDAHLRGEDRMGQRAPARCREPRRSGRGDQQERARRTGWPGHEWPWAGTARPRRSAF
jgi:hypothetical protein